MLASIEQFLSNYPPEIFENALKLRTVLLKQLPDIIEQLDEPAKMMGCCYGQKYVELICIIIPSKKGLKLGLNRGVELPDPDKLLQGDGKISRYVAIENEKQIQSAALKKLIKEALKLYQEKGK